MVPPYSIRITRVPTYSSTPSLTGFQIQGYHLLWPGFPTCSFNVLMIDVSGLFRVRSPLLTKSRLISFPPVTEMFHFSGFASYTYEFSAWWPVNWPGFPIRKSSDQSLFASSPTLIAGYYVLHRLLLPRHPPYALNYLTIYSQATSLHYWSEPVKIYLPDIFLYLNALRIPAYYMLITYK